MDCAILVAAGLLFNVCISEAQNVTVIGPVTPGNGPIFSSTTILKDSGGVPITTLSAPSFPLFSPGINQCQPAHSLLWNDQDWCVTQDYFSWTSNDPSVLIQATISGSVTVGDTVTILFTYGAGACSVGNGGCPVTVTAVGGDTLSSLWTKMATAIRGNVNVYNQVPPFNAGTQYNGGYPATAGSYVVGSVTPSSTILNFDIDARVSIKITSSVTGAATESVAFTPTNCSVACVAGLDVNPQFQWSRNPGVAVPIGSVIGAWGIGSTTVENPTGVSKLYGQISLMVTGNQSGSYASKYFFSTGTPTGAGVGPGATISATDTSPTADNTMTIGAPSTRWSIGYIQSLIGNSISINVPFIDGTLTPPALAGDVNDYNPTNLATSFTLRIDGGAADRNITGLAGGIAGRLLRIVNIGTTNKLVLKNQSGSSAAANRFLMPSGDVSIPINGTATVQWDGTTQQWRPLDTVLPVNFVTYGQIQQGAARSVLGVTGNVTANLNDIQSSAGGQMLNSTSTSVGWTATPTLGASGTLGSITFGNATSGLITLQPVTGALGTVTVSLPAITDTLVTRTNTENLSNKTFINKPNVTFANANLAINDTGTSFAFEDIVGGGQTGLRFGQEGSGAGGGVLIGSAAGDGVISVRDSKSLDFGTNSTYGGKLDSSQRWVFGPNNVTAATSVPVTVTRNTAASAGFSGPQPLVHAVAADAVQSSMIIDGFGTAKAPFIAIRNARGTLSAFTPVLSGDNIGFFGGVSASANNTFPAYDGTAGGGFFGLTASENWSSTNQGTEIRIFTTPNTTAAIARAMTVQNSGGVSVGATTDPAAGGLLLNGQFYMANITQTSVAQTGTVCWNSGGSPAGKFTVDTTVGCLTSLEEAKNILGYLRPSDALRLVDAMQPFTFRYRDGWGDNGRYEQYGLGAHQVASVDERLVGRDLEGTLHGVRYQELVAVLVGAIQELKADNDNIRGELNRLTAKIK